MPRPGDNSWTDDELAELRRLWGDGLPTSEIARRIGRTKNSVVGKAHRLKLPGRESPIRPAAAQPARPRLPRAPTPQQLGRMARDPAPPHRGRAGAAALQQALTRTQEAHMPSLTPASPAPSFAAPPAISEAVRLSGRACRYCLPSGADFPRWRHCEAPIPDDGRRYPYCDEHYARCIAQPRKQDAA